MILENWLLFEKEEKNPELINLVETKMPKRVKKRR